MSEQIPAQLKTVARKPTREDVESLILRWLDANQLADSVEILATTHRSAEIKLRDRLQNALEAHRDGREMDFESQETARP